MEQKYNINYDSFELICWDIGDKNGESVRLSLSEDEAKKIAKIINLKKFIEENC